MSTWSFTLVISPPTVGEAEAAERLYGAGCDDATFGVSNNVYRLDFDREAGTLQDAISSAIDDLVNADIGSSVRLVEVDPPKKAKKNARIRPLGRLESGSVLTEAHETMRARFLSMLGQLLFHWPKEKDNRPPMVRKLEEIFGAEKYPFGVYTSKVARILSDVTGHEINAQPPKTRYAPAGAFMVLREQSGACEKGDILFSVGDVHGFGTNIFPEGLGMRPDGTVGGCLSTTTARPAERAEIRKFLKKASPRALLVLAEVLEGRKE